ncbi:hypothetical protein [Radiobacillus sp. PE A8.2]|uniref:hypothetical protein n=1 Tax=Radiobacillus sp. PE A8.2 TaxID=3380349 RepID=UPI00388F7E98
MRKWRVGSISMGLALVMLGVFILLSQFTNIDIINISMMWLPIVLIALGLEIIVYIILSKQEQPRVQYDILSILFIIALGAVSLVTFIAISTGLVQLINNEVHAEVKQAVLPSIEKEVNESIVQIVINSSNSNVSLEPNDTDTIHLFGTYQTGTNVDEINNNEIVTFEQVGDTLYVQLLDAPDRHGLLDNYNAAYDVTLSLPGDINVEVRTYVDEMHLDLSKIKSSWYVQDSNTVTLSEADHADVTITMPDEDYELLEEEVATSEVAETEGNNQATTSFGTGEYQLNFGSVHDVIFR